jgi:two-component system KDP operon response regulator KdpE
MGRDKVLVLAVDDEPRYLRAIQFNLAASGFEVLTASAGPAAIEIAADRRPQLIILDVRMPGMDGIEVCRRIREFSTAPIIMLTAMADTAERVAGLDAGADDYVTKPFSAEELLARIRAALRRSAIPQEPGGQTLFTTGDLRVDFAQRRVYVRDREVVLTPTEYQLLFELVRQAGQVLVPDYLLEKVWGTPYVGDNHILWQAIHRLRRKIESDPLHPEYIETRPGIGYVFAKGRSG